MSWRDAPLYVEAFDLARYLLERAESWQKREPHPIMPMIVEAACDLACGTALALTFPVTRAAHLQQSDQAIVRLRTLLRLAEPLGLLSAGALRHACGRLRAIGRMVGGWRKRVEKANRAVDLETELMQA